MDTLLSLRIKYILTDRCIEIAAATFFFLSICILLLLTNIATPAIALSPLAEEKTQPQQSTHIAGVSQETTVTVTDTSNAFEKGEELKDKSYYPIQNTANPTITTRGDGQSTTVTKIEIYITYTATSRDSPNEPFYTKREQIAIKEVQSSKNIIRTPVNITEVFQTQQKLKGELGSDVVITPTIKSVVTYQYSSASNEDVTSTVSVSGNIERLDELYSLPTDSNQVRHEIGSRENNQPSIVNTILGALTAAFLVLFAAIVIIGRREEITELGKQIQAKRYDDWVTEINSYTPANDPVTVEVKSLSGLVNLAIDTHERVLYTEKLDEYIVVDGKTMYKYRSEDSDKTGGTEYFGFKQGGATPNIPEFDGDGTPISTPETTNNNPFTTSNSDNESDEK